MEPTQPPRTQSAIGRIALNRPNSPETPTAVYPAPEQAARDQLRTQRFWTFCISYGGVFVLAALGLLTGVDGGTFAAYAAPLVTFAMTAYGLGSWHDKHVRVATQTARVEAGRPPPV